MQLAKITKNLSRPSNWVTIILFSFLIWRLSPQVWNNYKAQGTELKSSNYRVIKAVDQTASVIFPSTDSRSVSIFWATWCGPCKIEMNRLQKSVTENKIPATSIFAINPFESPEEIKSFLLSNNYSFTFIDAKDIATKLNINTTPTILLIDKGKIISQSTGISITGIWRIELFLND